MFHILVSDSCYLGKAEDKSGASLAALIAKGIIPNGEVVLQACVPDEKDFIKVIRNII
jgi:molybdopterin biosynthesis enzyme MoaB